MTLLDRTSPITSTRTALHSGRRAARTENHISSPVPPQGRYVSSERPQPITEGTYVTTETMSQPLQRGSYVSGVRIPPSGPATGYTFSA